MHHYDNYNTENWDSLFEKNMLRRQSNQKENHKHLTGIVQKDREKSPRWHAEMQILKTWRYHIVTEMFAILHFVRFLVP